MSACSFSILTLNLVPTHGIPPEFRTGVHILLPAPHTIGPVPSLSSHAIAYRLRSLPRVRWHRASSPQSSSSNGCCLCITMDQMLLCFSLFPHPRRAQTSGTGTDKQHFPRDLLHRSGKSIRLGRSCAIMGNTCPFWSPASDDQGHPYVSRWYEGSRTVG